MFRVTHRFSPTVLITSSLYLRNNWERLLPSPFDCFWLCMSCLLDRDLGNTSYTVYLDMIWGQSVGFKQRGRCRLTERLHYLKWLFVFNFTFQLISSGLGHREVITNTDEPASTGASLCVCVCAECFMCHITEIRFVYVWKHAARMAPNTSANAQCAR